MKIIEANDVTKIYSVRRGNSVSALKNFTLSVEEGTVFGLLGPNGAGKTTLIKALLGMISVSSGELKLLGKPASDISVHSEIGYLPESHKFPPFLKGIDALKFFGKLSGLSTSVLNEKTDYYLKKFQLETAANRKIKTYSKGMMQRLGLIQAVIHNPKIIFLDEPTDGVDPIGRKAIRDFISELKENGKTVFINSHLLSEVEMICDRVAILDKGELVKTGTIDELLNNSNTYFVNIKDSTNKIYSIPELNNFEIKIEKNQIILKDGNYEMLNKIIDILRAHGIMVTGSGENKFSLEDFFIKTLENTEGNNE